MHVHAGKTYGASGHICNTCGTLSSTGICAHGMWEGDIVRDTWDLWKVRHDNTASCALHLLQLGCGHIMV